MLAVVLLSGGMDSCVSAALARQAGYDLCALHLGYGQRTEAREKRAFAEIADFYGIPAARRLAVSITHLTAIGGSCLTDHSLPVPAADLDNPHVPISYVPFRNSHILSVAVSWAETLDAQAVYIGAVHEDSSGYPDCRPEYFRAFNEVVRLGTARGDITIQTPVIRMSKSQIVAKAVSLGAPLELTWSCYRCEDIACGVCDSCALRLRGFRDAGMEDPLPYAERPVYR